jgi:hypothetical protein
MAAQQRGVLDREFALPVSSHQLLGLGAHHDAFSLDKSE